jgi:hypothetical protein
MAKGQSNAKDEIGNQYRYLTIIDRADNKIGKNTDGKIIRVQSMWVCKCVCGNIVTVSGKNLRHGTSKSCGCMGRKPSDVAFHNLYLRLKRSAEDREYSWKLDKGFVRTITSMPCHYCGALPNQISWSTKRNDTYIYNGIDRLNNSTGYEEYNCVPCCKTCNSAKGVLSIDDFTLWVSRIYHNLFSNNWY